MVTGRRIALLGVLWASLTSCGEAVRDQVWVHPLWSADFSFLPSQTRTQLLWQNGSTKLFGSPSAYTLIERDQKLVMVTYRADHPDRRLIEDSLALRALEAKGSLHHALLAMHDQEHVDDLAGRIHGHDAGFPSCGRIVRLGLNQSYDAQITIPAVYPDIAKLPAVVALQEKPKPLAIKADVQTLEALGTRFHNADNGAEVTATVKDMLTSAGAGIAGFSVSTFSHSSVLDTKQESIIARINGTSASDITLIIGAHFDSINSSNQANAPGADDDASGVATLAAILRAIAETNATFQRTIEFHAYAAEEVGLEGSRHIAETYADEGKKVVAMMQFDMNSFSQEAGDKTIWLVSNSTHINLRRSLKDLMHTYLDGDFQDGTLAGGTSDHEAWTSYGFPAVFPFENPQAYNKALHTDQDTSSTANNYPLAARFAQLGLAFTAHYAGLDSAAAEFEASKAAAVASFDQDLKLAITTSDEGSFHVAVATGVSEVVQVMLCKAAEPGSRRCFEDFAETDSADSKAQPERKVFTTKAALSLATDDRLVIFGYDQDDKVVAQRTVRLSQAE